jgi:hypothetical protein
MFMHLAFFVPFCVGLAAWTRQTDAKLSGTIGVWCGETLPARVKCKPNCAQNALQGFHNRGFSRITCQVRSCQGTVLYCTSTKSGAITFATPHTIVSRSSHSRGRVPISAFPISSLVPFENSYQLFPFSFLFSPFSSPLSDSETPKKEPICPPPPAPTANLPPGVLKKPLLQTYLCLRN